jgi:hypothetical protein
MPNEVTVVCDVRILVIIPPVMDICCSGLTRSNMLLLILSSVGDFIVVPPVWSPPYSRAYHILVIQFKSIPEVVNLRRANRPPWRSEFEK